MSQSRDDVTTYEIRIAGHLDPRWAARFDGLSMRRDPDGTTVLRGPIVDQAALHGLLQRVRDLGIPLVSVTQHPNETPNPGLPAVALDHEGDPSS